MTKSFNIADALHILAPGSTWRYSDEDYSSIEWLSEDIAQPSEEVVMAKLAELEIAESNRLALKEQQAEEKKLALESALAKLASLGLTDLEAKTVIGL